MTKTSGVALAFVLSLLMAGTAKAACDQNNCGGSCVDSSGFPGVCEMTSALSDEVPGMPGYFRMSCKCRSSVVSAMATVPSCVSKTVHTITPNPIIRTASFYIPTGGQSSGAVQDTINAALQNSQTLKTNPLVISENTGGLYQSQLWVLLESVCMGVYALPACDCKKPCKATPSATNPDCVASVTVGNVPVPGTDNFQGQDLYPVTLTGNTNYVPGTYECDCK